MATAKGRSRTPDDDEVPEPPAPGQALTVADRIRQALADRKMRPRALSMKAGLKPDAVRNILRGKSERPRSDTMAALAAALGVPVEALLSGGPPPAPQEGEPGPAGGETLEVPEFDLRRRGGRAGRWHQVHKWVLPRDLFGDRLLPESHLVVLRVPDERLAPELRQGERVLVDRGDLFPAPGIVLIDEYHSYSLAHIEPVRGAGDLVRLRAGGREEVLPLAGAGVAGRVLGRWAWL